MYDDDIEGLQSMALEDGGRFKVCATFININGSPSFDRLAANACNGNGILGRCRESRPQVRPPQFYDPHRAVCNVGRFYCSLLPYPPVCQHQEYRPRWEKKEEHKLSTGAEYSFYGHYVKSTKHLFPLCNELNVNRLSNLLCAAAAFCHTRATGSFCRYINPASSIARLSE